MRPLSELLINGVSYLSVNIIELEDVSDGCLLLSIKYVSDVVRLVSPSQTIKDMVEGLSVLILILCSHSEG